jgi:hypothetical protein
MRGSVIECRPRSQGPDTFISTFTRPESIYQDIYNLIVYKFSTDLTDFSTGMLKTHIHLFTPFLI